MPGLSNSKWIFISNFILSPTVLTFSFLSSTTQTQKLPLSLSPLSSSPPSTVLEIWFLPQSSTYTVFLLPAFSPICCFSFCAREQLYRDGFTGRLGAMNSGVCSVIFPRAASEASKWNLTQLRECCFAKCDFSSSGKICWSYISSTTTPGWHLNYICGLKAYVITQVIQMAPMVKSHSHHFSGVYTECSEVISERRNFKTSKVFLLFKLKYVMFF